MCALACCFFAIQTELRPRPDSLSLLQSSGGVFLAYTLEKAERLSFPLSRRPCAIDQQAIAELRAGAGVRARWLASVHGSPLQVMAVMETSR